ncbi:MAG: UDP-N-acetylglucosamine 1-carboxyvinyltransferase [bacterium]
MHTDRLIIEGLAGKKALKGKVQINGAKNAVLKAMAASVLFSDELVIANAPDTEDVKKLAHLLRLAGAEVSTDAAKKEIRINASTIVSTDLDHETTKAMRGSVMLTGPLLARFGKVSFNVPGGCVIGARPIDLYVDAYKKLGAKVVVKGDHYSIDGKLSGAEIFFALQTVGGTETMMMAAVLAKGTTVLKNCAMEPEIVSLAEFLVQCGANISGIGSPTMTIVGGGLLKSGGKKYHTIPDRIEAGSFLLLGALCADDLLIEQCNPLHLESVTSALRNAGVPLTIGKDSIHIKGNAKTKWADVSSFSVRTHEYPGFPTDLQPQMVAFLTHTNGEGIMFETIFEGRFKYVQDLIRMGAEITEMNPREVLVRGFGSENGSTQHNGNAKKLIALGKDEPLQAHDIRAGFAVVMAALAAKGTSVIQNVYYIDRGYEKLEERLAALGATIRREK